MPAITAARVAEHRKKVEVTTSYGDRVSVMGLIKKQPWGDDRSRTSVEIRGSEFCCGLGQIGEFDAYDNETQHDLLDKIVCLKEACRQARDNEENKYTKVIATLSKETDGRKQWQQAMEYCGFKIVGRGSINKKTGNTIWLFAKTL
jgi:hypothetical protein